MIITLQIKLTKDITTTRIKNVSNWFLDKNYITINTTTNKKYMFKLTTVLSILQED